ncbi:hypothetical protein ZIOFF_011561 [Zingiber officinale]|uniref:Uncharacterized protein n=1 Tax=Zingiber officinale TaxID=94328 RepID=A0A8J5HNC6_ZINOF|nr:hypothetical protein ZIOFF_011561 [Zingiber officinale]
MEQRRLSLEISCSRALDFLLLLDPTKAAVVWEVRDLSHDYIGKEGHDHDGCHDPDVTMSGNDLSAVKTDMVVPGVGVGYDNTDSISLLLWSEHGSGGSSLASFRRHQFFLVSSSNSRYPAVRSCSILSLSLSVLVTTLLMRFLAPCFHRNRRNPNCSARGTSCPAVCPDSSTVVSTSSFCRRDLLLSGLSTFILPVSDVHAMVELDDDVKMEVLTDDINAYSFLYPIKLQAKNFAFKWDVVDTGGRRINVVTEGEGSATLVEGGAVVEKALSVSDMCSEVLSVREKFHGESEVLDFHLVNSLMAFSYANSLMAFSNANTCWSSNANAYWSSLMPTLVGLNTAKCLIHLDPFRLRPMSTDARQRIVSERVDMINNLVISVSIGPPNSRFLTSNDTSSWNAKDVANSVLADKSSLRITTGQRMAESSVLDSHSVIAPEPNLFRHNVASTAERDGYLYSLNASTLSKQWENILGKEDLPSLNETISIIHTEEGRSVMLEDQTSNGQKKIIVTNGFTVTVAGQGDVYINGCKPIGTPIETNHGLSDAPEASPMEENMNIGFAHMVDFEEVVDTHLVELEREYRTIDTRLTVLSSQFNVFQHWQLEMCEMMRE